MSKKPSDNPNNNGVPLCAADTAGETDQFIAALESDENSIDSMTADDQAVFRLGAAIRKSTHDDLPPTSEKLREQLIAQLDHDSFTPAPKKPESKMSERSFSPFAVAACLLLALGLIAIMFAMPGVQRVREAARRDGTELRNDVEIIEGLDVNVTATEELVTEMIKRVPPSGTSEIGIEQLKDEEIILLDGQRRLTEGKNTRGQSLVGDVVQQSALETLTNDRFGYSIEAQNDRNPEFFGGATTRFLEHSGQSRDGLSGLGGAGGFGNIGGLGGGGGMIGGSVRSGGSGENRDQGGGGGFGGAVGGVETAQAGHGDGRGGDGYQTRSRLRVPIFGGIAVEPGYAYQSDSAEQYDPITENRFIAAQGNDALSTFSIDVDTASYANMRRFLLNGQRPPRNSIRIEELVNYFNYDYPQPTDDHPFSVDMELADCPWNEQHQLLRVALKGKDVHRNERSPSNLVFLLDVSGSMQSDDKLPLLKQGLTMMVQQLSENDSVSIVAYAGNAGVVLNPTVGSNKRQIEQAINQLNAGGSTNGSAGIEMAYELAQKQFINEGSNRVILATDGDLNVGVTDDNALVNLIKDKASEGVFLTVLGFGTGNLKDSKLEKLADNGNGMYAYIDSVREAHKVLIEQMSGSLESIAKDVKIQIEFNPAEVAGYRLIGYENRVLAAQDFDNDRKDAGEIGAGHSVTALYEIVPKSASQPAAKTSQTLKYQSVPNAEPDAGVETDDRSDDRRGELLTLALRYKQPDSGTSQRIEFTLANEPKSFSSASGEFRFAASVASFGMILRQSQHRGNTSLSWVEETASRALGDDPGGYRSEFLDLVRRAATAR